MDLPVITFIQERLAESDAGLETREGSAFYDLFVSPQELMLQPLLTAMETTLIAQSIRRILDQDAPDDFDEESVDALSQRARRNVADQDAGLPVRHDIGQST